MLAAPATVAVCTGVGEHSRSSLEYSPGDVMDFKFRGRKRIAFF